MVAEIIGVARSERTLLEAVHLGVADRTTADPLEAVRTADLVFIATPVAIIPKILERIAPALPEGCVVTDAGSTKRAVVAAASILPEHVAFVGGHPMAASEQAGLSAAKAHLFRGRTWFLTPGADRDALLRLRRTLEAIGARVVMVDAETHDRIVARTSHLPHLVAAALAGALGEVCAESDFIGNGLRDTTRIAAGPAEVWREILLTNADEVLNAIDSFVAEVEHYRQALVAGDETALTELLESARRCRERMVEP